jgi:hypothetical protein
LQIGGFVGSLIGSVRESYSVSPLEIEITSNTSEWTTTASRAHQAIGGFAGFVDGTINECYSTGAVTVISTENEYAHYFVGSFAGNLDAGSTINDSYATGNIMIDRTNRGGCGNTDASGFASNRVGTATSVNLIRCFSTAAVTVMSQRTSGGSVGGLLGYRGRANFSVALNPHITAVFGGDGVLPFIGRITSTSRPAAQAANSFAVDTLRLLLQVINLNATPPWTTRVTDVTDLPLTDESANGRTVTHVFSTTVGGTQSFTFGKGHPGTTREASLFTTAFWRNSVNFDDAIWDNVTAVTQRGHPTLKNVGGQ